MLPHCALIDNNYRAYWKSNSTLLTMYAFCCPLSIRIEFRMEWKRLHTRHITIVHKYWSDDSHTHELNEATPTRKLIERNFPTSTQFYGQGDTDKSLRSKLPYSITPSSSVRCSFEYTGPISAAHQMPRLHRICTLYITLYAYDRFRTAWKRRQIGHFSRDNFPLIGQKSTYNDNNAHS